MILWLSSNCKANPSLAAFACVATLRRVLCRFGEEYPSIAVAGFAYGAGARDIDMSGAPSSGAAYNAALAQKLVTPEPGDVERAKEYNEQLRLPVSR